jgi:hypothetical protein
MVRKGKMTKVQIIAEADLAKVGLKLKAPLETNTTWTGWFILGFILKAVCFVILFVPSFIFISCKVDDVLLANKYLYDWKITEWIRPHPDAYKPLEDLVDDMGLNYTSHWVSTEDGYMNQMYRVYNESK